MKKSKKYLKRIIKVALVYKSIIYVWAKKEV